MKVPKFCYIWCLFSGVYYLTIILFVFIILLPMFAFPIYFMQCNDGCIFYWHKKHSTHSQYFVSYGRIGWLIAPHFLSNDVPSEVICLITPYLVYFYRSIREPFMLLGYHSPSIVKSFYTFTFNLLWLFPLRRRIYER